jgi:hypothetical protein
MSPGTDSFACISVRIIVFQYKGGKGSEDTATADYHVLNPITPSKILAKKPYRAYNEVLLLK